MYIKVCCIKIFYGKTLFIGLFKNAKTDSILILTARLQKLRRILPQSERLL